jgi:hypothetical protein
MDPSRETHQQKMEQQIQQWGTKLGVFRSSAEASGAEAKGALQKQGDELHPLQESAKKFFKKFVSKSAEKWKDTKAEHYEPWTKLSRAFEAARHLVNG